MTKVNVVPSHAWVELQPTLKAGRIPLHARKRNEPDGKADSREDSQAYRT